MRGSRVERSISAAGRSCVGKGSCGNSCKGVRGVDRTERGTRDERPLSISMGTSEMGSVAATPLTAALERMEGRR